MAGCCGPVRYTPEERAAAEARRIAGTPPDVPLTIVIPCRNDDGPLWLPEIKGPAGEVLQGRAMYHSNSLQMTLDSIARTSEGYQHTRVLIVDDASDRPVRFTAPRGLPVTVLRNVTTLGVDPSRNIGLASVREGVAAVLDCHMQVMTVGREVQPGGLQRLAALAMERRAIVCGRCGHIELPKRDNSYPLCGAAFVRLAPARKASDYPFGVGWQHVEPPGVIAPAEAVLGGAYFGRIEEWRRLGGFINACRQWGASEEGLSLKAHFTGVPLLYCGLTTILHWFRCEGPHPYGVSSFHKWLNYPKVCKVVFEDRTFSEVFLPRFRAHGTWLKEYERELQDPELLSEMMKLRAITEKSDAEIVPKLFGVPAP